MMSDESQYKIAHSKPNVINLQTDEEVTMERQDTLKSWEVPDTPKYYLG